MEVFEAMIQRRSARAFKTDQVNRESIEKILSLAVNAPSANNLQPWEFTVVMGMERQRLSRVLVKALHEKQFTCGSGAVKPLPGAIRSRGLRTLDEMRTYTDRLGLSVDNFTNEGSCNFYGAPAAVIMYLDDCFSSRQFVDAGTFVGYFVLAAHAAGLATCPIGLITDYADEIKDFLNIPDNKTVVIGIAIGYPDDKNPINDFRSFRADINEMVRWF